jgi:hypothetical protein
MLADDPLTVVTIALVWSVISVTVAQELTGADECCSYRVSSANIYWPLD